MTMNYKNDFEWFNKNKNMYYLDSAATSLKPKVVVDKILNYYKDHCTNPHNDDSQFAHQAHIEISKTRKKLANLIHCDEDEVIFTSGATESLNMIAQSIRNQLSEGDEIILTNLEHSSNLLPWYRLRDELNIKIIFIDNNKDNLSPEMFLQKITPRTKIISFTGASNLLGTYYDVESIVKKIKELRSDIYICVDCAQRLGHTECDMKKWNIDFAAFSAHKMFGPTGIGATFVKKEIQEKIIPLRFGGGMNFSINKDSFCYIDGVEKFEGGTPNVSGIYGWGAAIDYLTSIGYHNIKKHENEIREYLKNNFYNLPNIEVYNKNSNSATIIFNYKGIFPQDLASYLGTKNIILRSGLSCAKLIDDVINSSGGVVRASFYVYNTIEDIDYLINILKKFNKRDILNEII